MKIIRNLALAAAAGAMALGVAGTTAASASPGPTAGAQAPGGSTPAVSAQVSGPTYLNEHWYARYSHVLYTPSKFYLMGGPGSSAQIFTSRTQWYSWGTYQAVGSGNMWGVRYGHRAYVGHVTMAFYQRRTDGQFIPSGKRYAFFGKVRISGILPGNGGSVQYWRWSWRADNWVYSR